MSKSLSSGRDKSIDVFKGFLVIIMVYVHVLQFFGYRFLFPNIHYPDTIINLVVFPSFVFAFGCSVSLAYLSKPFKAAWWRMLRMSLRALGAFYISGIAFRVIRESRPFSAPTVTPVLRLEDIPGWSEFLLAFALYGLLAMALFLPLKWLKTKPWLAAIIAALCLLSTFIPYENIQSPHLGLLIGTRSYVTFPILQYMPYFLLGIVFITFTKRNSWLWALGALIMSGAGTVISWQLGWAVPERFPPSLGWIILPAAAIFALMLLSKGLCALHALGAGKFKHLDTFSPLAPLMGMGRNSLFYLLTTNLVIFTFAGRGIMPQVRMGGGLWGQAIQSPQGAVWWTLVLLLACGFCGLLYSKPAGR